jgi:serine/threonine protein kinase
MEMQERKICSVCRKPTHAGTAHSITQWIAVCRCAVSESDHAPAPGQRLRVCADCRKRINVSKTGSITQWIFSENFCKCSNPTLLPVEDEPPENNNVCEDIDDSAAGEIYIDVDPADFPVERYKPLQFIGKGALGEVYVCRDVLLKKKVAIKILLNVTDQSVMLFQNEAKIASKLKHQNVINIFDFGTTAGGRPFMVMEYFPGKSLQEILGEAGKIEEGDALDIFSAICRSLQYLHDNGVMHRDLKPSNILVQIGADGQIDVRLIDFGLSKTSQDNQAKTIVNGNTIVGTPTYMSPDQAQGKSYDFASEVYSLGCMMFETITGHVPFAGATALEVLNKHVNEEPPLVRDFEPEVSPEMESVIDRCLRKNPGERFRSMKEVEESLCKPGLGTAHDVWRLETASLQADAFNLPPPKKSTFSAIVVVPVALLMASAIILGMWKFVNSDDDHRNESVEKHTLPGFETTVVQADLPKNQDSADRKSVRSAGPSNSEVVASLLQQSYERTDMPAGLAFTGKSTVTNAIKRHVKQGSRVFSLRFDDSVISDGDVTLMAALQPHSITFTRCTGITAQTLREVQGIPTIQALLFVQIGPILPDWLRRLSVLPNLRSLSLVGCNVTDEHLKALKDFKLTMLNLAHNPKLTVSGFLLLPKHNRKTFVFADEQQMKMFSSSDRAKLKENGAIELVSDKEGRMQNGNLYDYLNVGEK